MKILIINVIIMFAMNDMVIDGLDQSNLTMLQSLNQQFHEKKKY